MVWRIIVKRPRMLSAYFVSLYKLYKFKPKPMRPTANQWKSASHTSMRRCFRYGILPLIGQMYCSRYLIFFTEYPLNDFSSGQLWSRKSWIPTPWCFPLNNAFGIIFWLWTSYFLFSRNHSRFPQLSTIVMEEIWLRISTSKRKTVILHGYRTWVTTVLR